MIWKHVLWRLRNVAIRPRLDRDVTTGWMLDVGQEGILRSRRGLGEVYVAKAKEIDRLEQIRKNGAFLRHAQHDICVDL